MQRKESWIKSHSHVITVSQSAQKRTEVVHQPQPYNEPTITVNGQKLKVVDDKLTYMYLGSTLTSSAYCKSK